MSKLEGIKARTAARKAAGQIPVYSRHKKEKGATKPAKVARTPLPCKFLGEPTGETRPCQSCGGRTVQVPLRACAVYGVTAVGRAVTLKDGTPVRPCNSLCPGYQRPG